MARGQVAYTDAEFDQAIFGLGINETGVFDKESIVTDAAANLADRLVTFVEGSIQPAARSLGAAINAPYDTVIAVEGIEVDDIIVSAVKVFVGYQDNIVAGNTSNVAELRLEDVTADAEVTDTDEVTFANVQFEEGAGLMLSYVDVSRPDENE